MSKQHTHGVIVTKTPGLAFKTKDGTTCEMTFNKNSPDVVERLLFETIKLAFFHLGTDANKLIDDFQRDIDTRFRKLELEQQP